MPNPTLLDQQRQLLRAFRHARDQRQDVEQSARDRLRAELQQADEDLDRNERQAKQTRAQVEAQATERHRTERTAADAELATVRQETDARFQRVEAETTARYQAERQSADEALAEVQRQTKGRWTTQQADTSAVLEAKRREIGAEWEGRRAQAAGLLENAEKAIEYPRLALVAVKRGHLLPERAPDRDVALDERERLDPAPALANSSEAVKQAARAVESAAEELARWRVKRNWRIGAAAVAVVVVALLAGYLYMQWYNEQQRRVNAAFVAFQAPTWTAEAQAAQTAEVQTQRTAEAQAQQTAEAEAQQTVEAQAQQTAEAQQTAAAQARQTAEAEARQTAEAQATAYARATYEAQSRAATEAFAEELALLKERFDLDFVFVPAGDFNMGDGGQYTVYLDDYWIGLTEVTVEQYRRFAQAGGYDEPRWWTEAGWSYRQTRDISGPRCQENANLSFPQACVSWYEAVAYANWLSFESSLDVRLPTEAEWEKAARGTDGRTYPWGNQPPALLVRSQGNFRRNSGLEWSTVGRFPDGAGPYGALDMVGNVWEWTSSETSDYPYRADDGREEVEGNADRVGRGGSMISDLLWLSTFARNRVTPEHDGTDVGFRLVVVP